MKKILISAFSCLPDRGSEQGVGWNWTILTSRTQNVTLVTRTKNKALIEKEISQNSIKNLTVLYVPSSLKLRKISIYLEYLHWQLMIFYFLRKHIKKFKYDYIFHVTFGALFLPILIHKLGIPFVWGPIGGGEIVPTRLISNFTIFSKIKHLFKLFLIYTIAINPFIIGPAKKAKLILVRTNDTKNVIPARFHYKTQVLLETCVDLNKFNSLLFHDDQSHSNDSKKLTISYSGRLIDFKNVSMLIESLLLLKRKNLFFHLNIIGSGPDELRLKRLVNKYQLTNDVLFHGELTRNDLITLLVRTDIYAFPSLREAGTWSLIEAMALGKAIVCVKTSGMDVLTDDYSALRINVTNYQDMKLNFSNALEKLILNKELRTSFGQNARNRIIQNFSCKSYQLKINDLILKISGN